MKKYSNATIKIINKNDKQTKDEELVKDIISIMNVYVAKINGMINHNLHLINNKII